MIRRNTGERGFTLVELLIVMAIIAVLCTVTTYLYFKYVDAAKRTVTLSTLENVRHAFEEYASRTAAYPQTFDFVTCLDQNGEAVLSAPTCDSLKKDTFSLDRYTQGTATFTLEVKAVDQAHTVMTLTPTQILYVTP